MTRFNFNDLTGNDKTELEQILEKKDYTKGLTEEEEEKTVLATFSLITLAGLSKLITPEGAIKVSKVVLRMFEDAHEYANKKVKEGEDGK